jgi:hypothetical protein
MPDSTVGIDGQYAVFVKIAIARHAEDPRWHAKFVRGREHSLGVIIDPLIQVPPARAVGKKG